MKLARGDSKIKAPGKSKVNDGSDRDPKGNAYTIDQIDGIKIINGKVDGKVPIEDYKKIRVASVHNVDSETLMLGKYTPTIENGIQNWDKAGPDSYIAKAGKDSTYLDLS